MFDALHVRAALVLCAVLSTPLLACNASPPPPPAVDAEDFQLDVRDFHWEIGASGLISIRASGEVRYVYWRREIEHRDGKDEFRAHAYELRWALSPAQLRQLQVLLDEQRVLALAPRHVDEDVDDGWSRDYTIQANGLRKSIYCSNEAPEPIRALDRLLATLLPQTDPGPIAGERELSRAELEALGLL